MRDIVVDLTERTGGRVEAYLLLLDNLIPGLEDGGVLHLDALRHVLHLLQELCAIPAICWKGLSSVRSDYIISYSGLLITMCHYGI